MEDLRVYQNNSYIDVEDIVNSLMKLSNATAGTRDYLTDAVYDLKAIAQNEYNKDYYRVLYNTLILIADKNQ